MTTGDPLNGLLGTTLNSGPFFPGSQTTTGNNTSGGYIQVPSVQDLMQQQALQQAQYMQNPIGQAQLNPHYGINQYHSQVERLLPLNPKYGELVSLFWNGEQWEKLPCYTKELTPTANFSLDEIAEAADIIDEIEHGCDA